MNYCGKCGRELDPETGLCPKCNKIKRTGKKGISKKVLIPIAIILVCAIAVSVLFATGLLGSNKTISEADAEKMVSLISDISNLESQDKGATEIREYLSTLDWIEHIDETEDGGLTCSTSFGVTGVWTPKTENTISNAVVNQTLSDITNTSTKSSSHMVRSIALLCPYASVDSNFLIDYYSILGNVMTDYANSSFTVFKDNEVSLDLLKHLDRYDMVWFYSHGSLSYLYNSTWAILESDPYTMTGEFANDKLSYITHSDDFFTGRTVVNLSDGRIGVGGNFYKHYYSNGQLKNTFFHFASCNSMRTDALADGLLSRGAAWVEGWSESVYFTNDYGHFMKVIEGLINEKTSRESIVYADTEIKEKYPKIYQNDCKLKGKGNDNYTLGNLNKSNVDLDEELNKAFSGSVSGGVISSKDNSAIKDVSVTAYSTDNSEHEETEKKLTDDKGGFKLVLPAGSYDLEFQKDGYKSHTLGIKIDKGVMTILKDDIVLEPDIRIDVNNCISDAVNESYSVDHYSATCRLPKFLIDTDEIAAVNSEILNKYNSYLQKNERAQQTNRYDFLYDIDYTYVIYDNILSLMIENHYVPSNGYSEYSVYNIDISSASLLSRDEMMGRFGIDWGLVKSSIRNQKNSSYGMKIDEANISDDNLNNTQFYIGEDKKLYAIYRWKSEPSMVGEDGYRYDVFKIDG